MEPTFEKIRDILTEQLGLNAADITPASRIREDLGADSLDVVEIIMNIEEEFATDIPDASAEQLLTVQDIIDFLAL